MALPDTYRKVVATKFTTNFREAAAIVEEPLPTPEADEVLVRNLYAGVNATDVNVSAGLYTPGAQPPIDLGLEVLGEVVAVGDGVEHLQVGMPIIGMYTGAGYREYSIHKAAHVLPVPEPKPEYMALLLSGMTAAVGLNVTGEMKSGETVLVTAAAGGTGQIAVQLAKMAGNHVIGTCSTEEKAAFLRELGCDRVINYRQEDFATVIQEEYPNKLDIVYESVGRQMFDVALDNLAVRGRLVIIGAIAEYVSGPEVVNSPRIWTKLLAKSASVRGMFLPHFFFEHLPTELPKMIEMVATGKLRIQIDPTEFRGVDAVVDAVEFLHSGKNAGKVVVRF